MTWGDPHPTLEEWIKSVGGKKIVDIRYDGKKLEVGIEVARKWEVVYLPIPDDEVMLSMAQIFSIRKKK